VSEVVEILGDLAHEKQGKPHPAYEWGGGGLPSQTNKVKGVWDMSEPVGIGKDRSKTWRGFQAGVAGGGGDPLAEEEKRTQIRGPFINDGKRTKFQS